MTTSRFAGFAEIRTFTNRRADFGGEQLTVVSVAPAAEPGAVAVLQLELAAESRRATVVLDREAVDRLDGMLFRLLSARTGQDVPCVRLSVGTSHVLVVAQRNWGDRYDDGAQFSLRPEPFEPGVDSDHDVSLTNDELEGLRRHLCRWLAENRPQPAKPADDDAPPAP